MQTDKCWKLGGTCKPYIYFLLLISAGFHSNTLLLQVPEEEDPNKYRIKYPLEPQSKFELQQKAKKEEETEPEQEEEREEEVVTVSKQGPPSCELQEGELRHR